MILTVSAQYVTSVPRTTGQLRPLAATRGNRRQPLTWHAQVMPDRETNCNETLF